MKSLLQKAAQAISDAISIAEVANVSSSVAAEWQGVLDSLYAELETPSPAPADGWTDASELPEPYSDILMYTQDPVNDEWQVVQGYIDEHQWFKDISGRYPLEPLLWMPTPHPPAALAGDCKPCGGTGKAGEVA